ncbi:MAG: sugar kinase [Rectinema sp.]|jgi:2-dehydro-3-deoxygluconokinase
MKEFLSFGEPLVGFYPPQGVSVADDYPLIKTWGGDTSNFAIGVSRLGHSVSFLTAVGNDPFGRGFLRLWKANGVDISLVRIDRRRNTGLYFVSFEEGRHALTYYRKNSASSAISPKDIPSDIADDFNILHLSGISLGISASACRAGMKLMEIFREKGRKISFDINFRLALWKSVRQASQVLDDAIARGIDYLEITDDEMLSLGWGTTLEELTSRFKHVNTILFKRGSQGTTIYADGEYFSVPAFQVQVRDTVGAGDSFDAGYLSALLDGASPREAARFAAATAALTCTGTGPLERMPYKQNVARFLGGSVQ